MESIKQVLSRQYQLEKEKGYDHIELTEEEAEDAIRQAKIKKGRIMEHEEKIRMRKLAEEEALKPWNANDYWKIGQKKGRELDPDFKLDEHIKPSFEALCLYFANDPRFEERGHGSLSKGLFLTGNVGIGKTILMNIFCRNKRQCFEIVSSRKLVDAYQEDGVEVLYKYFQPFKALVGTFEYFLQTKVGICIDDLGTEETTSKNFGNSANVLEKIILNRYDNRLEYPLTHFTSNLDGDQIEQKYGTRVRSRLREMCNFFEVPGNDRRK